MWNKIVRWLEPMGLFFLLAAFGWQCMDEQGGQMKIEGYLYETNEKLITIWEGVYDEALHSDRYNGKATVTVNYDVLNSQVKDWKKVKEEMAMLEEQSNLFFRIRVALYVLGSVCIIVSKWPPQRIVG